MKRSSTPVSLLLFGSGFCALVYQTAWMRQFRLVFGASTLATAAVLAIFMGGLGIGSALLGRRADENPNPLRFYGNLELWIALSAGLSQPLLWLVGKIYIALGGSVSMGLVLATIVRLILSAIVLAIPTVLMGGTLPAAARAVETTDDAGRRKLALLYGINTLGAVAGALASTFFLLENLGNRKTLFVAMLINLLVAVAARSLSAGRETHADDEAVAPAATASAGNALPVTFVYLAAGIAGFAFLLMELVWYRMLAPILGGSTFAFGLILAIALLGIALGGAAYSLWSSSSPATSGGFALTCTLEAAFLMIPFALGDRLALLANDLRVIGHSGFVGFVFGWSLVTAIVVLPAAIVAGVQFPLLIALLGRGREEVGTHVGRAYAWNTLGAIGGSLAGGFGFLPLFTAKGCWLIAAISLLAIGLGAVIFAIRAGDRLEAFAAVAIGVAAALCGIALGPTAAWRHSGIGSGRASVPTSPNETRKWENLYRRALAWEADGRESAIGVIDTNDRAFLVNGSSDGSARGDANTQVMAGMVGAMLHPGPHRAFVVGLGTGSTAGWLGAVPTMDKVTVVELEPVVLRMARECSQINQNVLNDPKVEVRIGDAREVLLTSRDHYDLVVSEPSNPYRAGVASLFTKEFYEAVASRLNRGGMFQQWVQGYYIDAETMRTIYATVGAVFPHVNTWRTSEGDLLLVASRDPIPFDIPRLRQKLTTEPYKTAVHGTWRAESAEGFLAHFVAEDRLTRVVARHAMPNTDDQPLIEFGFARSLGDQTRFNMVPVMALAATLQADRPAQIPPSAWQDVVQQRQADPMIQKVLPEEPNAPARSRLANLWLNHHFPEAAALWRSTGSWPPINSAETAMIAESLAIAGSDGGEPLLEQLRGWEPIEADAIDARNHLRKGDSAGAAQLLEHAFVEYRTNPWPEPEIMSRSLAFAVPLGATSKANGIALYEALGQPFATGVLKEPRLRARLGLAQQIERGCGPRTIAALKDLEPWVPWEKSLLQQRAVCYERAGLRELAQRARSEAEDFVEAEPEPLVR